MVSPFEEGGRGEGGSKEPVLGANRISFVKGRISFYFSKLFTLDSLAFILFCFIFIVSAFHFSLYSI